MASYYVIDLPSQTGKNYGILGKETDLCGDTLQTIAFSDISCNKEWVSHLAKVCTDGQLALEHLYDVICDMLP